MLLEQAIEQFEIWHQRSAPRLEMKEILFQEVQKIDKL
jgi:shikimate 5-dehydrogenase